MTEKRGDDGGIEADVEQHPASSHVLQVVGRQTDAVGRFIGQPTSWAARAQKRWKVRAVGEATLGGSWLLAPGRLRGCSWCVGRRSFGIG